METLQRLHNRGSISTDTGYNIDNSLKLDSANSEYLYIHRDATGSDWNRLKWTASMWVKHMPTESSATAPKERMFGAADANSDFDIRFRGQPIGFRNNSDEDGVAELRTTAVYRDYSAWYHIVAVWDTANATAGNRMRLYVNGEEVTDFSTDTQPSQNEKSIWGKKNDGTDGNVAHTIGAYYNASSGFAQGFNGYMAEVHWVEGQALAPSDFGETDSDTGIWIPKEYSGSHGTNGFYLDFSNSSSLGADASGNSNNWSLNNISAADQATDTPTNNFCTLNPLMANAGPSNYLPLTEGGTKAVNDAAAYKIANSTIGVSNGKWYWEVKATDVNGVTAIGVTMPYYWDADYTLQGCIYYGQTGQRYNNASASSFGNTYTDGDIISFALDMDATPPTMTVYKNNSSEGNLMSGLSINGAGAAFLPEKEDGYFPKVVGYNANTFECNFGGYTSFSISSGASDENGYGTFEYAPPSGYYALCTKNLAEFG